MLSEKFKSCLVLFVVANGYGILTYGVWRAFDAVFSMRVDYTFGTVMGACVGAFIAGNLWPWQTRSE